ncbi:MAG: hypothetical protein R3C03_04925 [Pirellulaceae bacterium]
MSHQNGNEQRLRNVLQNRSIDSAEVELLRAQIERRFLDQANHFQANGFFSRLTNDDLRSSFELLDSTFFNGMCSRALDEGEHSLGFRLGKRMTSCGGRTTTHFVNGKRGRKRFEIAISPRLISETFEHRESVLVTGVACVSPLQAMLRIMEHEMVHMLEMLMWHDSSCAKKRFRSIAQRIFGHMQSTHQLLTPKEVASACHQITVGNHVVFQANAHSYTGVVNHIECRATVLVLDPKGIRYNDGNRYRKFYVPLSRLRKAN